MDAYIELEVSTSIIKNFKLGHYWNIRMFMGILDFKIIISYRCFQQIRSNLTFYPYYDYYFSVWDPLWNSRKFMEHFLKNSTKVAVPVFVSSFD